MMEDEMEEKKTFTQELESLYERRQPFEDDGIEAFNALKASDKVTKGSLILSALHDIVGLEFHNELLEKWFVYNFKARVDIILNDKKTYGEEKNKRYSAEYLQVAFALIKSVKAKDIWVEHANNRPLKLRCEHFTVWIAPKISDDEEK